MNKAPIIFIVGPTASGKSNLSYQFCFKNNLPIVNADSVQIFQEVNIGTAKPSAEEFSKVDHHLYNIVEPGGSYTAGDYYKEARAKIIELSDFSVIPVVGGSGFYIKALENGMFEVPDVKKETLEEIENLFDQKGQRALYDEMLRLDPELSGQISENDLYRVKRALGLMKTMAKPMSIIQKDFNAELEKSRIENPVVKIGLHLERDKLRVRVSERAKVMLSTGLIEETEALLKQGLIDWAPLKSVGYKETVSFLNNEIDKTELLELIVQNTMRLAKKQMTWFKKDKMIKWFHCKDEIDLANQELQATLN